MTKGHEEVSFFRVAHTHVWVRSSPNVEARRLGLLHKGKLVSGQLVDGWLLLDSNSRRDLDEGAADAFKSAWALVDGEDMGYGMLLEKVASVRMPKESAVLNQPLSKKTAEAQRRWQAAAARIGLEDEPAPKEKSLTPALSFSAASWLVLPPQEPQRSPAPCPVPTVTLAGVSGGSGTEAETGLRAAVQQQSDVASQLAAMHEEPQRTPAAGEVPPVPRVRGARSETEAESGTPAQLQESDMSAQLYNVGAAMKEVLEDLLNSSSARCAEGKEAAELVRLYKKLTREMRSTFSRTTSSVASGLSGGNPCSQEEDDQDPGSQQPPTMFTLTQRVRSVMAEDPLRLCQVFASGWRYGEWYQDTERFRQRAPFGLLRGRMSKELLEYFMERPPFNAVSPESFTHFKRRYGIAKEKFQVKHDFLKVSSPQIFFEVGAPWDCCTPRLAATSANFTAGLAGRIVGEEASDLVQASVSLLACTVLVLLLRCILVSVFAKAKEGSMIRLVIEAMLDGLPWFVRVPGVVLVAAGLSAIYKEVSWHRAVANRGEAGEALLASFAVFFGCFGSLLALGWCLHYQPHAKSTNSGYGLFLLQTFYLAFMSMAGKAMHYCLLVVTLTMAGPLPHEPNEPTARRLLVEGIAVVIFTAIAWYLISGILPNQSSNVMLSRFPYTQLHLICQEYVVAYAWAFVVVNWAWQALYGYLGSRSSYHLGMVLFCLTLVPCLLAAVVLAASTPDKNFYKMGENNRNKATACVLNFWLIDDIVWWGQSQIVAYIDTDVEDLGREGELKQSSWPVVFANFAVAMGLLLLIGVVHALNVLTLHERKAAVVSFKAAAVGNNSVRNARAQSEAAAAQGDAAETGPAKTDEDLTGTV